MKILLAHVVHSPGVGEWYRRIAAAAGDGLDVRCFCVTLRPPGPRLGFSDLDRQWGRRDPELFAMYRELLAAAEDRDVLLLYNGANVHPEFLACLPTFNVYCCFDDPESSRDLSAPVAPSFDAVFYGNVASRFQYESWGCRRLAWLPIFTAPGDVPGRDEGERLLSADRTVEVSLVCEFNRYRRERLAALARAYPGARFHGPGWEAGRIGEKELFDLYSKTKIGWNVHNSTGPINRRLFTLPGFGVLQICDNKTGLGHIFRLDREAVGFDTIPEAVEKTRHYLEREEDRREIARNGWRRYWEEYHAGAVWNRIAQQVTSWMGEPGAERRRPVLPLPSGRPSGGKTAAGKAREGLRRVAAAGRVFIGRQGTESDPNRETDACRRPPDERHILGVEVSAYRENPGMPGMNLARERLARGEPFEWPNMLALNWAVTSLIGDARTIVEIGAGTGAFAQFAALDPGRTLHCFEEDDFARGWAERNRVSPNVSYFRTYEGNLRNRYDLLVAVDVVEHAADLDPFLSFCAGLAPRAILTTPNRAAVRGPTDSGPPAYLPHVREFDAGEFYWVLRLVYEDVRLYHMPDVYVPWLEPMTIGEKGTPIIAHCRGPLRPRPGVPGSD